MLATPIEVKKAYKEGTHKKNYRFVVLNDDGTEDFTIDNDTLVAESVHIDERMATGSELKFGLCEGSSLEFQYFDHPNINGRQVQAFIDIDYGEDEPYSTPMGYFTVKECPRQFSTGIYKATAYNKLQSDYLDADATDLLASENYDEDNTGSISLYSLLSNALEGYSIDARAPVAGIAYYMSSPEYIVPNDEVISLYDSSGQTVTYHLHILHQSLGLRDDNPDKYIAANVGEGLVNLTTQIVNAVLTDTHAQGAYVIVRPTRAAAGEFVPLADVLNTTQYDTYFLTNASNSIKFPVGAFKGILYWQYTATPDNNYYYPLVGFLSYNVGHLMSSYHYGATMDMRMIIPIGCYLTSGQGTDSGKASAAINSWKTAFFNTYNGYVGQNFERVLTPIEEYRVTSSFLTTNVTLRELQSAVFEISCQFGQLDRVTDFFSGVELNGGGLYPAETLYPADGLYPNSNTGGQGIHPYPSEYSQLWTDTMGEQSFRYLIITYKTLDGDNNEVDAVLQRTVNADGTIDYNMSDNWLFRNLVWTAADVGDYADAMVLKMQNIRWFPFEMWAAGLPYVETGDAIEITDREGNTHNSYILQRQLQGIQNLQDTYVNGELDIF